MLVDTNVLLISSQPSHPDRDTASAAIRELIAQGAKLQVTSQNLVEFWVAATRPAAQNGLGMTVADAAIELARLKSMFFLIAR